MHDASLLNMDIFFGFLVMFWMISLLAVYITLAGVHNNNSAVYTSSVLSA